MPPVYLDEIVQGSSEWKWLRMGLPTCSQFHRIITSQGKRSTQWNGYISELIAEHASEYPTGFMGSEHTERGKMLEPRARAAYEIITGHEVKDCGFVYRDENKLVGGSPDGLVGEDGLIEIKAPSSKNHVSYMIEKRVPVAYVPQTQGYLWCTGRKWLNFVSFHPEFDILIIEVLPEPRIQDALSEHLPAFLTKLEEARELIGNHKQ